MTTNKTTFDFYKQEQKFMFEINPGTILHIHRISHSVAHLYFTDSLGIRIPVGSIFAVYSFDFQNLKKRVLVERDPVSNNYLLCWTEKYEMEWNGEIKLVLQSQRQWDIITG